MAITISGENNNDRILAQDGVIDQISGINIVGLITASHINVGSNINLGNAGIITATTFVGNLTGNVNSTSPLLLQTGGSERFRITGDNALGIAGANYGSSGQVLTSGGSGSAVTWSAIPSQVSISNNADNRVITGGSGTNLNGEASFTWDGNKIHATATGEIARFQSTNSVSTIRLYSTASSHTEIGHTEDTYIAVGGSERLRIHGSSGELRMPAGIGPQLRFENQHSVTADAAISTFDDASGTLLCLGSNFYINSSASVTRYNTSEESTGIILNRQGYINLYTGSTGATAVNRIQITETGKVQIGLPGATSSLPGGTEVVNIRAMDEGNLIVRNIGNLMSAPSGSGVGLDVLNNAANAVKDLCIRGAVVAFRSATAETLRIDTNGQVRAGDESSSNRTSYRHQFSSTAGAGDVLSLQNPSNSDGQGIGLGFWARNTNNSAIEVAKIKAVADETQANSTQKGSLQFLTNIGASMGERMRITNAGQLYLQANSASGYTAEFRSTHADNPAWIDINSPTDNDLRPAYIQLSRASSKKWGIGMVYSPTSAGSFHIGTGSHSQSNSKFTITTAGRIGVGNVDPGGAANGSIDITTTDNTTGHGVLTDQRGRSNLVIRNKSGTLYSYSQLMFTNGNDGYNSATFLRHTKGGYLQNENFIGDLILMTRVAGNGSANPDFREKTTWPGGTTKAKQIWWANGTGQQGNATHMGWHHMAEQNPQGNDQYQYFTLDLGAASYSRAGLARYVILWNTGHASGTGHQTGEFRWFNHHQNNGACSILEHIILRRGYNNGSYYGWNDAPRMALFHSSNLGNDSCIHLRCQGRRSSGYDMGLYVTVFIDLYAPKSSNGNVTPTLRARGSSAPSDISASEFTNDGRNASYVSYQDAAPDLTANP